MQFAPTVTGTRVSLSVTSPRTGVTSDAVARPADLRAGTWTVEVRTHVAGRASTSVLAHVGVDGAVEIRSATRCAVDHARFPVDVEVDGTRRDELVAGARFMWSKMADAAQRARLDAVLLKIAELSGEGDEDGAARMRQWVAA